MDGPDVDDELPPHFKEKLYLVTSGSVEDKRLWKRFREMAEEAGYTPGFVQPEWVHRLAVTQDIEEEPGQYEFDEEMEVASKTKGKKAR